ncbi:MAG: RNA polymerase sigma factor [Deltaproteobacteria bacterium]|nr:RNA polymerase sigma factor [Deltaproteobacteria bacterium]
MSEGEHLDSAELFRRFAPFVASFLLRMGVERADLEDVLQEVFLVAHRNGGYSPGPAKPTTYLANIAFRAATTHRRKNQTRSFVYPNQEIVANAPDVLQNPENKTEHAQRLRLLQKALDALDDDKRTVFILAELYGETVVSIAAGLGIQVDTAYSRLRAARRLFRAAARELYEEEKKNSFLADYNGVKRD